MATPKKLYPVEGGGIDLSSCRLFGSIGDSRYCKNLFREANRDILDFVQQLKFMEMFFREIKHSLNWSVVLVKKKLKTQQLLRKQSLKRNGYSWRKKPSEEKNGAKVTARTSLIFEACAAVTVKSVSP